MRHFAKKSVVLIGLCLFLLPTTLLFGQEGTAPAPRSINNNPLRPRPNYNPSIESRRQLDSTLIDRAARGHASAQYELGAIYSNGEGAPQDFIEAKKWYLMAALQGHAKAQNNLGLLYITGEGIPQDYAEAEKWFLKAAQQGFADAQFNLGVLYIRGEGVPQGYATSYAWFAIAAIQGSERATKGQDFAAAKLDPSSLAVAQKLSKEYFRLYVEPF